MTTATAKIHRKDPLATPTDLGADAVRDLSGALTKMLADMFALARRQQAIGGLYARGAHGMR